MHRLVDYFFVVGFDPHCDRSVRSRGKILQRFPEVDWNDVPFNEGVSLMVQPLGWRLKPYRSQPTFFASVLTGEDGTRHYFASLSFSEPLQLKAPRSVDDDEDGYDGSSSPGFFGPTYGEFGSAVGDGVEPRSNGSPTLMYAPKCLVLVSRVDYFATFKNCLGIVYAVCLESRDIELETVVGNMLCCVTVPQPGGPEIRFSIGAGDRQSLQPPLYPNFPVTQCWVAQLFTQLGIRNTIQLLCAVLTEHKILFHSSSLNRLTEACHALVSLMFPFRYNHVYIPVVPASVLEVLETPTPFIIGIHSSLRQDLEELNDILVVDLDGGSLSMLDTVPLFPEPLLSETRDTLSRILHPDLNAADLAFPTSGGSTMMPASFTGSTGSRSRLGAPCAEILDKEIRALFMRTFAKLLQGYRSCLTIIRIQPKPVIEFDEAAFLGQRGLSNCPFMTRLVERMFFTSFVQERGPPWRPTDLWDDVYSSMNDWQRLEAQDSQMVFVHIKDLAEQLYHHEHPNPQPYVQSIPRLTEGAASRIYQPQFPTLNGAKISEIIKEGNKSSPGRRKIPTGIPRPPRIVPIGPLPVTVSDSLPLVTNSARRLEVLRNCVRWIFENKTADARKLCPAVARALKSKAARLALCEELKAHVPGLGVKVELDHQQFEMVAHLMNCALWDAGPADENVVAAALLPLSISFCRKLSPRIYQFAYTAIQNHKVWEKLQFWETAYYQEVERQIKLLYKPWHPRPKSPDSRKYPHEGNVLAEPSALEIAADQMRQKVNFAPDELDKLTREEESTLYSQASQFVQLLVFMRVPLDSGGSAGAGLSRASESRNNSRFAGPLDGDFDGHSLANSVAETDSLAESGFEDAEVPDQTIRFVGRFIDKVCNEGGVSSDRIAALHENVRLVVAMHVEDLECVNRESKRLPPIRKPEIMAPRLIPGERLVFESLRAYLLSDGREEPGSLPGSVYLPAEGAVFLTNYRIIFKGAPCDPSACEQTVLRSIPIMTVTKEKKLGGQYLTSEESWLQENVQIRSAVFQLFKLGFDTEVTVDKGEAFRKKLAQMRHPEAMYTLFCFSDISLPLNYQTQAAKDSAKNATLRGFAKKTFLKTAQKAGLASKKSTKKKNSPTGNGGVYGSPGHRSLRSVGGSSVGYGNSVHESVENLEEDDDLSGVEDGESKMAGRGTGTFVSAFPNFGSDQKTLDKLSERRYVKDFKRFLDSMDGFRLTVVNVNYKLTNSYPAAVVVPDNMSDEAIRRLSRLYRHSRFPCFSWRHDGTGALLLRGAGFQSKNAVIGLFRNHHLHPGQPSNSHGGQGNSSESSAVDQEKFLTAVVKATPLGSSRPMVAGSHLSDSSLSINSLTATLGTCDLRGHSTLTPEVGRKTNTSLQKAMTTLRDQTLFRTVSNSRGSRMGFGGTSNMSSGTGPSENYPLTKGGSASSIGAHMMGKGLRFLGVSKRRGVRGSSGGGSGGKGSGPGISHHRVSTASNSDGESNALDDVSIGSGGVYSYRRSALYVFGDKSQIKGLRGDVNGKCDFVPIEYPDGRHVKASFKNVLSACVPSKRANDPNGDNFFRDFEKSEWLNHLQKIMQLSGAVVDLMDLQGSSVMLCVEDGSDLTAQVSSIAQLCLDPYYRTMDGFRVLVEKEWLAFGHKFSYRTGHTAASQTVMPAPFFLQFLDIVHQIHHQFPMAFEFNQYYLRFLAYHSMSYRFKTFVFIREMDRVAMYGQAAGGASVGGDGGAWSSVLPSGHRPRLVDFVTSHSDDDLGFLGFRNTLNGTHPGSPTSTSQTWDSVFDYIEEHSVRSPTFFNFLYSKEPVVSVLRPFSTIPNLEIWDFFVSEDLSRGSCYDFETAEVEDCSSGKKRRTVMAGYDCVEACSLSGCLQVLENLRSAQMKLGRLPQMWKHVWDKLELPTTGTLPKAEVMSSVQYQGRLMHKRSTVEILLRGRMTCDISPGGLAAVGGGEAGQGAFSHPHRFERYNYTAPTYCDYCSHLLWGIVRTGMKCSDCGYNAHEKCMDAAPKNCPKVSPGSLGVDLVGPPDADPEPPSPALTTTSRTAVSGNGAAPGGDTSAASLFNNSSVGGGGRLSSAASMPEVVPPSPPRPQQQQQQHVVQQQHDEQQQQQQHQVPRRPQPSPRLTSLPPASLVSAAVTAEEFEDARGFGGSGESQTISAAYLRDFKELQPRHLPQDRGAGYHDGYLYKRGAKLKAWPRRWFVLDPMKHQLRYYHSKEDDHLKGFIDLDRVQSAVAVNPPSGLRGIPKGVDDKSFFDLVVTQPEGTRRVYNFCAFDGAAACEWIEKIQACL